MAPLIPRMHLFEIDDQPWFPPALRTLFQAALTVTWTLPLPIVQSHPPAKIVAQVLLEELGSDISEYSFVDFCAGAGGPTPFIENYINAHLRQGNAKAVNFTLTDLHPNIQCWDPVAAASPHLFYESKPVDATNAPRHLVRPADGKKSMRLFNLAFHHFDDCLAARILKDTVESSDGFAIFELQDRSLASFVAVTLLAVGTLILAPYYAMKWRSPLALVFSWLVPILPAALAWDGYVSSLRTREPEEVEALLRSCGADASRWELRSGSTVHLWPVGYVNWIVCRKI
ncbi:unnamed protein product [Clonostachys rhizophaga]|uniref:Uncharacterized protein n=1 Tax=Clonostachys rhizophaga TaxID=160324 RepID=A0A9N9YRL0_9HYPO|nr:unnamed protein product [Clonostachys rhizophaga]